jgi:hypothetical protein
MNLSANSPMIKNNKFLTFFSVLQYYAASAEIDGSLGDSDSLKEAGSKKRYAIFFLPFLFFTTSLLHLNPKTTEFNPETL